MALSRVQANLGTILGRWSVGGPSEMFGGAIRDQILRDMTKCGQLVAAFESRTGFWTRYIACAGDVVRMESCLMAGANE